jgi:molecular chaperone DnaK
VLHSSPAFASGIHGGRFRVAGEAGDPWLGGDDFDRALANYAADQFEARYNVDLRRRRVEWQRLLLLCEAAKRRLSTEQETKILAKGIVLSIRGPIDLDLRLDRDLLTRLCGGLADRSIECVSGCLDLADQPPETIDHVVLVGGVSRMPLVRERVQEYFQREVRLAVNPEHAVVLGNAVYAHQLACLPVDHEQR